MRRVLRLIGAGLLWLAIAFCVATVTIPAFLDRIYYRGPASAHFDGKHFANPDGDATLLPTQGRMPRGFPARFFLPDAGRPTWPDQVPVTPARPLAHPDPATIHAWWVGHATALVQANGLNILTDPVWSDTAGPFGIGPRRVAAPAIPFEDLPRIDLVLVSHDHYDHLDLATLKRLWQRDHPLIVTSLGNDSVIGQAGVPSRAVDWGGTVPVRPGIDVVVTRNHHWSSRWMSDRNRALWSSFVVRMPGGNLFFAGDTGAGNLRWADAARAYGPIRLALLPIGAFRFQPGQMAAEAHMGPIDAMRIWARLGRPMTLPIHWGTFHLSWEARDTPPAMLHALMACMGEPGARFAGQKLGAELILRAAAPFSDTHALDDARLTRCAATPAVAALP
jgi:L-ascorbate metabolism protein UlaG (beta-lactamase superfamily)